MDKTRSSSNCNNKLKNKRSSKLGEKTKLAAKKSFNKRISSSLISKPIGTSSKQTRINPQTLSFADLPKEIIVDNLFFGNNMSQQLRVDVDGYNDRIPVILMLLAYELQKSDGLIVEGIFRKSANQIDVDNAKKLFNQGNGIDKAIPLKSRKNVHIYSALIKDYFRSLPISLLNSLSYNDLETLTKNIYLDDKENSKTNLGIYKRFLLDKNNSILPNFERTIFIWLLDLLAHVNDYKLENRMGKNIDI